VTYRSEPTEESLSILKVKVLPQELVHCLCSYGVRVDGTRKQLRAEVCKAEAPQIKTEPKERRTTNALMPEAATKEFTHRVGVTAELCFDLESDLQTLDDEELRKAVRAVFDQLSEDDGFDVDGLLAGRVYPRLASPEAKPHDLKLTEDLCVYDTWSEGDLHA